MPGLRFKLWPIYEVERFDWVQVPPDHIGLVIAQVGDALPTGAKSARLPARVRQLRRRSARSSTTAASAACSARCCLPARRRRSTRSASSSSPATRTFGKMVSESTEQAVDQVDPSVLKVVHITPQGDRDVVGVVTTLEGPPSGDIASRIGGFDDVRADGGRRAARRSRSSRPCCGRRTTCTTTTRTTRRSSTTAAASACSTTRCCTARTCSTRSS